LNAANYAAGIGVPSFHREHETHSRIFASPFEAAVEAKPEIFQIEIINLHSCEYIKSKFLNAPLVEIYILRLSQFCSTPLHH
jgi:hypothetical protein